MFGGKAGEYPRVESRVGKILSYSHTLDQTGTAYQENIHSSLLGPFISDEKINCCECDHGSVIQNYIYFVTYKQAQ
jgi:hypothetical protein